MKDLPNAEDLNYWKTSSSNAGTWLDRAEKTIEGFGGTVTLRAKGRHGDRAAYMLEFQIGGDQFRAIWPILPSRTDDEKAAERQAATMLHHDVKARALRVEVFGARTAFFDFLLLGDGRTVAQLSNPELESHAAKLLPR